jgi:FkbM family methyltransferase
MSNSYRLEKDYGWQGVCIEPHPETFKKLKQVRSCHCLNRAIYTENDKTLQFLDSGDNTLAKISSGGQYSVQTVSFDELLKNCPREIDYISLDIEGLEPEILKTFPFDKYKVKFWTIEHNLYSFGGKNFNEILSILLGHNYFVKTHDWDFFAILDEIKPEFYYNWKNI